MTPTNTAATIEALLPGLLGALPRPPLAKSKFDMTPAERRTISRWENGFDRALRKALKRAFCLIVWTELGDLTLYVHSEEVPPQPWEKVSERSSVGGIELAPQYRRFVGCGGVET